MVLLVQVRLKETEEPMHRQHERQLRLELDDEPGMWEQLPPDRKAQCLELLAQLLDGIARNERKGDEHDDE